MSARHAAWVAAALFVLPFGLPSATFAQQASAPAAAALPQGPYAAEAEQTARFDARQKVLDRRTELNDYNYGVAVHNCYSTFFVNACIDRARDKMRDVRSQIRKEQLALDEERRTLHAQQRDEQLALQRAQDAADAPQRAANEQAYNQKQADYQQKLQQAQAQAAQKAQERAENVQHYQQKQADAAQHKADVDTRQKQAADKQQQQQQQQLQQQQQQEQLKQQQEQNE